jgi:uncharacterized OB-fold protein
MKGERCRDCGRINPPWLKHCMKCGCRVVSDYHDRIRYFRQLGVKLVYKKS